MDQTAKPQGIAPAAKKGIVVVLLVAAVGIVLAFLFLQGGPRQQKIIGEGDRAPDFSLPTLDGRTVKLSDLRGKVVMVHFWATWCPPCVEEIPTLDRLAKSLLGKDFEMLAVSVDESGAGGVLPFLQRNRLTLPVLLDPGHEVARTYGTFKFPETYIIGRDGIVKAKVIGARNWADPAVLQGLQELIASR